MTADSPSNRPAAREVAARLHGADDRCRQHRHDGADADRPRTPMLVAAATIVALIAVGVARDPLWHRRPRPLPRRRPWLGPTRCRPGAGPQLAHASCACLSGAPPGRGPAGTGSLGPRERRVRTTADTGQLRDGRTSVRQRVRRSGGFVRAGRRERRLRRMATGRASRKATRRADKRTGTAVRTGRRSRFPTLPCAAPRSRHEQLDQRAVPPLLDLVRAPPALAVSRRRSPAARPRERRRPAPSRRRRPGATPDAAARPRRPSRARSHRDTGPPRRRAPSSGWCRRASATTRITSPPSSKSRRSNADQGAQLR